MSVKKTHLLTCPIDNEILYRHNKQLVCDKGHSFDIAKQGYINLLPAQHKRSKSPGDSKDMVVARKLFLNTGLYKPIAIKITQDIFKLSDQRDSLTFVDAGCGEGYYFDFIYNEIKKQHHIRNHNYIGMDISKPAIIEAAKRNNEITWVVGTNRQPPIKTESVDIIICVFGFHSFDGFKKILKTSGKVILVEPGADHLQELRNIIYPNVKKSDPPEIKTAEELGFTLENISHLQFKTGEINNQQINHLLQMTPHFFRANKERRELASNLDKIDLTIDIVFRTLEKRSESEQ